MKKSWLSQISFLVSMVVVRLPLKLQYFIGDAIGVFWFDILRVRRRVALENLRLCFPDLGEEQRVHIARSSLKHLGRTFLEFWRLPAATPDRYKDEFVLKGEEHLRRALTRNHGAFILSSHIGSGDWASTGLALRGIYLNVITKEFKNKTLNQFWFETRQRFGMGLIPDRRSSLHILKILKRNGLVGFVLDQFLGPPIGVRTKFFGKETGTPMGLALLAERSGAAVVPGLTYRGDDGRTYLEFEPEIPFVETGNKDENIRVNTQLYCDKIEEWVRKHPEQWMWVHRRWKEFRE
jgi:Kdo2-lipid IVA lauroyltransferase/acyltransferase